MRRIEETVRRTNISHTANRGRTGSTKKRIEHSQTMTPEMIERGQVETFTAEQVFPYIVVRISEGRIEQPGGNQAVNILLNFGVYDPDKSNNGYLDILHMIETIRQRFFKNPILNHRYECESKMEWALQDEESYPYNFGSLSMNFLTAPIEREDEWA